MGWTGYGGLWGHTFIIDKTLSFFFHDSSFINSDLLANSLTDAGRSIPRLQPTNHYRLNSDARKSILKSVFFENAVIHTPVFFMWA